jgi:hypothetical protein
LERTRQVKISLPEINSQLDFESPIVSICVDPQLLAVAKYQGINYSLPTLWAKELPAPEAEGWDLSLPTACDPLRHVFNNYYLSCVALVETARSQ